MRTIDSPCLGCPIRHETCHSECTFYKNYKEDKVTLSNVKKDRNMKDNYFKKAIMHSVGLRRA